MGKIQNALWTGTVVFAITSIVRFNNVINANPKNRTNAARPNNTLEDRCGGFTIEKNSEKCQTDYWILIKIKNNVDAFDAFDDLKSMENDICNLLRGAASGDWCLLFLEREQQQQQQKTLPAKNIMKSILKVPNVHSISTEEQIQLSRREDSVGKFTRALTSPPHHHSHHQLLGYLFAIQNGAKFIHDVQIQQNVTNFGTDMADTVRTFVKNHTFLENITIPITNKRIFHTQSQIFQNNNMLGGKIIDMDRIALIQYISSKHPETHSHSLAKSILSPPTSFVPFTAQSTVYTYSSFWSLLLPGTIASPIIANRFRAYISQCILRDLHLRLVIKEITKEQERINFDPMNHADMVILNKQQKKEEDLIRFLDDWVHDSTTTLPSLIEQLWLDLAKNGHYIGKEDLQLARLWLMALTDLGFQFPTLKMQRIRNTLVMGQFNYDTTLVNALFWVQKWREHFHNVLIRGPFNEKLISDLLQDHGIIALKGRDDHGYLSPMENLMRTLNQYNNHSLVDGILYVHDDAIPNITEFASFLGTKNHHDNLIIATGQGAKVEWRNGQEIFNEARRSSILKVYPNATFKNPTGQTFTLDSLCKNSPDHQQNTTLCENYANGGLAMAQDSRVSPFADKDGGVIIGIRHASICDVLYVSMRLADDFAKAAQIVVDAGIFLEVGLPTIVQMVRDKVEVRVRKIVLCSNLAIRGTTKMIAYCDETYREENGKPPIGFYHPFKMGQGLLVWDNVFDHAAHSEQVRHTVDRIWRHG